MSRLIAFLSRYAWIFFLLIEIICTFVNDEQVRTSSARRIVLDLIEPRDFDDFNATCIKVELLKGEIHPCAEPRIRSRCDMIVS